MNYNDKNIDFIVFGGGITSDVLSLILKNENKQFYILDDNKNDKLVNSPRSLALSPSSMNLLNYFKIDFPFEKLDEMRVYESDLSNNKIKSELVFNNEKTLSYVTKYNDLKHSLLKKTKFLKNRLKFDDFLSFELEKNLIKLVMKDGKEIFAKNIIFTQKIDSTLLSQFKLSYKEKNYNQKAIVATLEHKASHEGVAYQYYDNGKPLALLPLSKSKDSYRSSLIWSLDDYFGR